MKWYVNAVVSLCFLAQSTVGFATPGVSEKTQNQSPQTETQTVVLEEEGHSTDKTAVSITPETSQIQITNSQTGVVDAEKEVTALRAKILENKDLLRALLSESDSKETKKQVMNVIGKEITDLGEKIASTEQAAPSQKVSWSEMKLANSKRFLASKMRGFVAAGVAAGALFYLFLGYNMVVANPGTTMDFVKDMIPVTSVTAVTELAGVGLFYWLSKVHARAKLEILTLKAIHSGKATRLKPTAVTDNEHSLKEGLKTIIKTPAQIGLSGMEYCGYAVGKFVKGFKKAE